MAFIENSLLRGQYDFVSRSQHEKDHIFKNR